MFYYVIYNSSIGNFQDKTKKYLTTFLYGSIMYLLSHALITRSQSIPIPVYYFWIMFAIDCLSMFYMYSYLQDKEDETLISMVQSLFGQTHENEIPDNSQLQIQEEQEEPEEQEEQEQEVEEEAEKEKKKNNKNESQDMLAYNEIGSSTFTPLGELEAPDNIPDNISEAGSDPGSDLDLDAFESLLVGSE